MADRTISAEAIISARDGTGDTFTKIAAKFQQLGKGAKVSADIEKAAGAIAKYESQLVALDKAAAKRSGFTDARAKFRDAEISVQKAARALREAEGPTKELEQAYKRAQAQVSATSAAFERSKSAFLDAKHSVEGFGTPLSRVAEEQARLRAQIESTTRAIEHQATAEIRNAEAHAKMEKLMERRSEGIKHHGIANLAIGTAAGVVSAHGVLSGVERSIHAGAAFQHEVVGLQNAGRTPEEIAAIQRRSSEVVERVPTTTYLDNLKVIQETTGAFGSVEHAMDHLEFMTKAMSVLKASGGEHIKGGVGEVGQALAKTFEERLTKPEDFEKEASAMIPAMVASGGIFNPQELYNFAQQAKSSLPNYSMRFLSRVAPSLIAAMGGDRAGTAANAFTSVIMGKANDKKQAEAWENLGLLDMSKVITKGGHVVSWTAGAVKESNLALSDPLEWAEKVALPAMVARGIKVDDRLELAKELGTMFRNTNSAVFASEMMQTGSRNRLHKDEHLYGQVGSLGEIFDRNLHSDPTVALTAFNASLENLETTLSGPGMKVIATGLTGIASGVDMLANVLKNHPIAGLTSGVVAGTVGLGGAGYASYQLMNGFGLGTSATALDSSAAALDTAAAELSAAAVKMGVTGGVGGAAGALGKGAAAAEGALGGVGGVSAAAAGALILGGVAAAAGGIYALSHSGLKRQLASDQPGFGHDFSGSGVGFDMGPQNNGQTTGHWVTNGRAKNWVADSAPPQINGPYSYQTGSGRFQHWAVSGPLPTFATGYADAFNTSQALPAVHPSLMPPVAAHASGSPLFAQGGQIEAKVEQPIDVTGRVELVGQANVRVSVAVTGGTVTDSFASSSGNIKASVGPTDGFASPNTRAPGGIGHM